MSNKNPTFLEKIDDLLARYLAYFSYQSFSKEVSLTGKERVLEVGCGGGNLSRFLAKRLPYGKLICVDSSDYQLKRAKARLKGFKNIEFELSDVLSYDCKENYFDVVVVHYILHDIEKEKRRCFIENIKKGLKQGGKAYIREPTRKGHGMPSEEIRSLMLAESFLEQSSEERFSFPLGKVYKGVFQAL